MSRVISHFFKTRAKKYPPHTKLWFPLFRVSTHAVSCRLHLQFPFVFRRLQSLQLLLSGSPFSAFRHPFLGLIFPSLAPIPINFLTPAVFAFFRPLQFWVLTTQPLFLPFPLLPGFASQGFPRCSVPLSVSRLFPSFGLVSHAVFRLSVLGLLMVSFRPALLRSRSCSTGDDRHFRFWPLSLTIRFLSSPSGFRLLTTQPSVLPFLSSLIRRTAAPQM